MNNYVGIDLGTTNSAICSYDGEEIRIWKSPEQNDVTPSVIYIDKRGNKYIGKRAYDAAPSSPDNAAMLFKRLMGTSTLVSLSAIDLVRTPEECSAEVLKVLYGYLPEEIRNESSTGTVITVPAAFNQMQKDATMQASELAGLGMVALMQEPVAAVMKVMQSRKTDGAFVIYDLGGGTLDVAIAESLGGRVNLLAHGGIAMCGGRDWDRALLDNIVKPWLRDNFDLPSDFSSDQSFKGLTRLAAWAAERAKIELSSNEETMISLSEMEIRMKDLSGSELYFDIPLSRSQLDKLIEDKIDQSIEAARETLSKAGFSPSDIERLIFVGGPTNYKPLRDKVSFELGIPGSSEVNPMTAVAEGAALFAESIDWSSQTRGRKSKRGKLAAADELNLSFNYIARTPDIKAKVIVQIGGKIAENSEFQIDSLDTGWTSGRLPLKNGSAVDLSLGKNGENTFKVFVFDAAGGPLSLENNKIIITRTAATVDAIPASYSIGIEVLEKLGGRPVLEWLVKSGDQLPIKGNKVFKTSESLKAGASGSLNFKLWEGEITDPVTDNRFIGMLKVTGADFDDGVIPAGAELMCDYEVLDSGNIKLKVSIPSIGGIFDSDRNFYSRQEGQLDFTDATQRVREDSEATLERLEEVNSVVQNPKLDQAREKLQSANSLDQNEQDSEVSQEALENVLEAKKLLAQVRKENLKEIRQLDLDGVVDFFNNYIREQARPSEINAFDNLSKTAQREIDSNGRDFENHLDELKNKNFEILWRQDWFVVEKFRQMVASPHNFSDPARFREIVAVGAQYLKDDDIDNLRQVVAELWQIQINIGPDMGMLDVANIIRG